MKPIIPAILLLVWSSNAWGQWGSTCQISTTVTPAPLFACPRGDGPSFADQGWSIDIQAMDLLAYPIPGIPPTDVWIIDCDPADDLYLCGGAGSSDADDASDDQGYMTMSQTSLSASGCVTGVSVVIQGIIITDPETHTTPVCLPVAVRSTDVNADGVVDVVDLSLLAMDFPPNVATIPSCVDFNFDDTVNIVDLTLFAVHFGPPGHMC